MSTVRSSAGDAVVRPEVPTAVEFGEVLPPPPSIEKKLTPVNMLSSATMMKPPIPSGIIAPPDLPLMSSMLLRSPDVQRIGASSAERRALDVPRARAQRSAAQFERG